MTIVIIIVTVVIFFTTIVINIQPLEPFLPTKSATVQCGGDPLSAETLGGGRSKRRRNGQTPAQGAKTFDYMCTRIHGHYTHI